MNSSTVTLGALGASRRLGALARYSILAFSSRLSTPVAQRYWALSLACFEQTVGAELGKYGVGS